MAAGCGRRGRGARAARVRRRARVVPLRARHPLQPRGAAAGRGRRGQSPDARRRGPRRPAWAVPETAGMDLGDAGVLLVRRHGVGVGVRRPGGRSGGRRAVSRCRTQGRARRRAAGAGIADLRSRPPGPLPEHAARVQAPLADEPRRLVPRPHSAPWAPAPWQPTRSGAASWRSAWAGPTPCSAATWVLHRRPARSDGRTGMGAQPHLPGADLRVDRDRHGRRRHAACADGRRSTRAAPDPHRAWTAGDRRDRHRAGALHAQRARPRPRRGCRCPRPRAG